MKKITRALLIIILCCASSSLFAQTFTFTNVGANGANGPTQSQVNAGYVGTSLEGQVVVNTQGIQEWTVPVTASYRIDVLGAQGGTGAGNAGGFGAGMSGDFILNAGQTLKIVVGQQGIANLGNNFNDGGPGGGGSFVVDLSTSTPLIVAGGGGGGGVFGSGANGVITESGTDGLGDASGRGGINGGGGGGATSGSAGDGYRPGGNGSSCSYGAGGGGFYSRGGYNCTGNPPLISGFSFLSGAQGGAGDASLGGTDGGFGGGAGSGHRASGGGGYSGGGGSATNGMGGGAGGSYNSGTNQVNNNGIKSGHGQIIITQLCENLTVTTSPGNNVCPGTMVTITATSSNGGTITWDNGISNGVPFRATTTTTYTSSSTHPNDCPTSVTITVEDSEAPVLDCPANITQSNDAGTCGAIVTFNPTASDNCDFPPTTLTDFTYLGVNGGNSFYISNNNFTPANAFAHAIAQGGNVATIADAAQNEFLLQALSASAPSSNPLIGFNDVAVEGSFVWQDGSPVTYTNWQAGEPNNSGDEDYTQFYTNIGTWNDITAPSSLRYVLQLSGGTEQTAGLPSGSVFPVGITPITFVATDASGNTATCSFNVTVVDNEAPIVECQDLTIELDSNGQATITSAQLTSSSQSYIYALDPFSATDNIARYTYDAGTGNLMIDNTYTGNTGFGRGIALDYNPATNSYYIINRGSSSSLLFSFDVNNNDKTLLNTLVSVNGNTNAQAMVFDDAGNLFITFQSGEVNRYDLTTNTMLPFAILPGGLPGVGLEFDEDANRLIHASGDGTTTLREIDLATANVSTLFSFNTPCGTTQAMAYVGNNTIIASSTFGCNVIYSVDLITQSVNLIASPTGTFPSIKDFAFVAQGPSDNCGIASVTVSPSSFSCSEVGPNTVTVTVTDVNGNISTCTSVVTVEDNIAPLAICQNITVALDATGNAIVTPSDVDNGSTDNCSIASLQFTEHLTAFAEVGEGQTLTITLPAGSVVNSVDFASYGTPIGSNGNYTIGSCHAPNSQSIVESYALGNNSFSILADNAVFGDPCFGVSKRLYVAVGYSTINSDLTFSCADIGLHNVTLYVTDASGNTSTCNATITVEDNMPPVISCVPNATRDTDLGVCEYTVVGTELDATFTDNCPDGTITNDYNGTATMAGAILPKGVTTIVWTVDDGNGQTATCTTVITVEDNEAPVISCVPNATRYTDPGLCQYTVVGTELDATFTDNCQNGTITNNYNGTATMAGEVLSKGTYTVIWTVNDGNGQTATCTTVITVEDNEAPVISCVPNPTRDTDPGLCEYTVIGTEFDATFTDNCPDGGITNDYNGTATMAGEILPTGTTTVVWTVNDGNGQSATCTTVITIEDNEAPIIACPANINANTDAGECFATVSFAAPLAFDNCGIASVVQTMGDPSGSGFPVGVNTIEFTATDINGNTSTCSFTITVTDNEAPVAVCQNITIQLDAAGNATIAASDVDGGSTDNCGVASMAIDIDTFGCSDVGDNNVILTVTDVNGNTSTCTAIVTVEDVTAPMVVCQDITVELDPVTGTVTIAGIDLDGGSTDACGIDTYTLDMDTFDCSNVGDNTVTLTVTDVNGNTATCTATVTVEDNTSPVLVCQDFTLELGADGTATLDPSNVIASNTDNCSIFTTAVDITEFSCADIGAPITVQVFTMDVNGNLASCTAQVTVVDLMAPVISCPADQTVDPGTGNLYYILPDYFASGEATAIDNCTDPVTETAQSPAAGTPLADGTYTITLTATDEYGNTSTCDFELIVESVLGTGENNQNLGSILMYPNPAKGQVTIANPQSLELEKATIYDLTGRLVQTFNLKGMATTKTLNIDQLAAATYVVIIEGKKGAITKRLIKE